MKPETDVQYLKGVGSKRAYLLARLGISNIGDLLHFYPRAYEDWSRVISIADAPDDENVCICAVAATDCRENYIRKGMTLYKCEISDGESILDVTFFNNKYAAQRIVCGEEYLFWGKISRKGYRRSMNSPVFDSVESGSRIRPIYPQTEGLNTKAIEKLVALALRETSGELSDSIPSFVRKKYCLMGIEDALNNIHFPKSADLLAQARRRLIFEELLLLQLGMLRLRSKNKQLTSVTIKRDLSADFYSLLPFEPTNAQKRAIAQGIADMQKSVPMNRLLQGDVGSGKTAVAAAMIFTAAGNGYQSALMAPTEVLARQHYLTLSNLFDNCNIKLCLLTGSTPAAEKKKIKADLSAGAVDLVIGTHALIQSDVVFSNLGLVVTDEQHRFGVNQRSALGSKGEHPHTLVMSATPIPRTLSLIIYGDLDLSILDELPKGRQKTETYRVDTSLRERAYGYVKKHLCNGRQGYIVCPLIIGDEQGDSGELVAAEELYKSLADGFFKGFSVGLLHGKMKADEKRDVMARFASGEIQLLVSTTVIEVGIDVPNAVIMVIENAERFGLSQLHQLRGRIGRGKDKSTCILISDASAPETAERLDIIVHSSDGFKIADEDLRLRGPGDFFGSRQHGLPEMKLTNFMKDGEAIRETRSAAELLLREYPSLAGDEFTALRSAVNTMFGGSKANSLN